MLFQRTLLFGLLACVPVSAQSGSVSAPVMGYAFDGTARAIRPIRGIPGASLLGEGIDAGFPVAMAAIAPSQDFALAVAAGESRLRLLPLSATSSGDPLPQNTLAAPSRIRFSASGSAALLFQDAGRLQSISGLPGHPSVRDIDLSALTNAPNALAISDDGLLVAISDEAAVWLVNQDGAWVQLALPGPTAILAFRRNSHDLLGVSNRGDVHLVGNPDTQMDYRLVYAAGPETANSVGGQFSAAGSHIYTVNQTGNVAAIEIATGSLRSVSCGCRATSLDILGTRGLYRLTPAGESVLMLFDGSDGAAVWFVPPGISAEAAGGVQ
jgi:hypothetical protein